MELTSDFQVSAYQNTTEAFERFQSVVHWGFDPISYWAGQNNRSDAEMAIILGCPLAKYQQHVRSYNHYAMRSPLSGQQVLDFCHHAGIHPTDLCPESFDPRDATPMHIYEALVLLYQSRTFRDDQEYAGLGLYREEIRYKKFVEDHPDIAGYHADIKMGMALQSPEPVRDCIVQGEVLKLQDKGLRLALLPSFGRATIASLGSTSPLYHAEDYHMHRHNELARSSDDIQKLREASSLMRLQLTGLIADHYGVDKIKAVMDCLAAKMGGLRYIGGVSDNRILQSLANELGSAFKPHRYDEFQQDQKAPFRYASGFYVSQICDLFYRHAVKQEDISHAEGKLETELRVVKGLDLWIDQAESEPHLAYTMRLYCNQALAPDLTIQFKRRSTVMLRHAMDAQGMTPD